MADTIDDLLPLRNLFHLGSYQTLITKATTTPSPTLLHQTYLYRAYIAQQRYSLVISSLPSPAEPELQAVKLLAQYLSTTGDRTEILDAVRAMIGVAKANPAVAVVVASVLYAAGELEGALTVVQPHTRDLDCVALVVQIYLKIERVDLARKEVAALKAWADDATLAQLVEAWVCIYQGGEQKYQEAFYVFEELTSSTAATSKLLTGQAVCRMHAKKFAEAEGLLHEALNKSNNDQEALVNLIILGYATGKADAVQRYTSQLQDIAPSHQFLEEFKLKESLFDRCAQRYTVDQVSS